MKQNVAYGHAWSGKKCLAQILPSRLNTCCRASQATVLGSYVRVLDIPFNHHFKIPLSLLIVPSTQPLYDLKECLRQSHKLFLPAALAEWLLLAESSTESRAR